MNNLYKASTQWAQRPDDERYWSIPEMIEAAKLQKMQSVVHDLEQGDEIARVQQLNMAGDLALTTTAGKRFALNNWSLGQVCSQVKAPSGYLVGLGDPELIASCLTKGLQQLDENERSSGISLMEQNGLLRSIKSQRYGRIWDCELLERMLPLVEAHGWKVPPARPAHANSTRTRKATAEDLTRSTWIKEGDLIGPAGLYRGDRDMFCFLVNDDSRVDDGSDGGISRGFIVQNSEVGRCSFTYTEFGFRNTCGNHIIWGVQNMREIKLRHIGADLDERAFQNLECQLVEYVNSDTEQEQLIVKKAKRFILGQNKEEVLAFLFGKRLMTRTLASQAYEACALHEQAIDPASAWGIVNGLTRVSQEKGFADERTLIDAVAATLLRKVAVGA